MRASIAFHCPIKIRFPTGRLKHRINACIVCFDKIVILLVVTYNSTVRRLITVYVSADRLSRKFSRSIRVALFVKLFVLIGVVAYLTPMLT